MVFVGWSVNDGSVPAGTTLVMFVLELLPRLVSGASEPTLTMFVTKPRESGVTVTVIPVELPEFTAPKLQVTMLFVKTLPGDADTKVTLTGMASVTETFEAT